MTTSRSDAQAQIDVRSDGTEFKIDGVGVTATADELNALADTGLSQAELDFLDGATAGTQVASKAVIADANVNTGVSKVTELHIGVSGSETQVTSTAAELNKLDGVTATAAELNVADGLMVPITLPMPFTIADRGGISSNGVFWSHADTADFIDYLFHYDDSATTYTDESADAQSAGTGDVTIPDPFDTGDIVYFGGSSKYSMLRIDIGTAGAGDAVDAETVWEYYNGSTWATLATSVIDSSTKLTASAGLRFLSFEVPSDWAATSVNSQSAFWIRLRSTADDVYNTTNPVLDDVRIYKLASFGDGIPAPATGTITSAYCYASTNSATNNDTKIQIVNITQGTAATLTWTKGDGADIVTGLALAVTVNDKLAFHVIQEDGTTEFANGSITLYITA